MQTRLVSVGVAALLHLLLIYGLVSGLAQKTIVLLPIAIETKIIDAATPQPVRPLQVKPQLPKPVPRPSLPETQPPDINIPAPVEPQAITPEVTAPQVTEAPAESVVRVAPRIDVAHSSLSCSQPEYPAASERLGEQGTAAISLLIGADGSVRQSRLDRSSGYSRLDDATIKAFSKCKFIVGKINGIPEASWFSMRYKWVVPE